MRMDSALILLIVAWGRPTVRGEIPLDRHRTIVYANLRACTFANAAGRSEDCAAFYESLRATSRMPAIGPELLLQARGAATADTFESTITHVGGAPGAPMFDLEFKLAKNSSLPSELTVEEATRALDFTLSSLIDLGARADLDFWTANFATTRNALRGDAAIDETKYPPGAPKDAVRLAVAASYADVFGGMGSWNDFNPLADNDLEDERSNLSGKLYDAMQAGLRAAANAM